MSPAMGRLPAAFTSFVGRRHDIAEARRLLGTARLVTLTGTGGIGKTRLALETAASVVKAFPEGVWLVDLAPVRDPSMVVSTVAAVLRVPDPGAGPVLDRLTVHLARHRSLIVLDNCEHVIEACAELVGRLLSAAPELRILATSRQTLGVVGEHVLAVTPLPPQEAADLLRDRATAVHREFRITPVNRDAVNRLCAGLEGLPLCIELAASRLRTLPVEEVITRLERRFELLSSGDRTSSPRQRTLRAMIDWSHELCSPTERLLWNRLSVFASTFDLNAAENICVGGGIDRHQVLDLLDRLVSQSIVLTTEREGMRRYMVMESLRQYADERLVASGEKPQLLVRHRDYYLTLAEGVAATWFGPGQVEGLALLRAEHDNLRAALEYGYRAAVNAPEAGIAAAHGREPGADRPACGRDDAQAALALAVALRFHWCNDGFLGEGRRQFDRLLAVAPEPTATRARALWVAAWVALLQGDRISAADWLDEADQLARQLDEPVVHVYVQGLRGTAAAFYGRPEDAVPLLKEAVMGQTRAGEEEATPFWLFQLALAQATLGDPLATRTAGRAVAVSKAHGERLTRGYALWAQAFGTRLSGSPQEAAALMRAAFEMQRGFDDYVGTALMMSTLADIAKELGDHWQAARYLGAAHALMRDLDTGGIVPLAQNDLHVQETVRDALGSAAYAKALSQGGAHDSPSRAVALVLETGADADADADAQQSARSAGPAPLTRREQDVVALVAEGMSNRQIAAALVVSPRTVDRHIANVLTKFGFKTRAQIAVWWAANHPSTS